MSVLEMRVMCEANEMAEAVSQLTCVNSFVYNFGREVSCNSRLLTLQS